MTREISVVSAIEKSQLASDTPFLVLLEVHVTDPETGAFVETLYLVNNNEDIEYQNGTWTAARFDIQLRQESGAQPEITLSISDYANVIQTKMQQYRGGVGFTVRVMVVNTGNMGPFTQPEVVEDFEVIAAASANYQVSFTLGAVSALSKPFPRRRQMRDFCAWIYKGTRCRYAGELTSCDLTLSGANGCKTHNNVINFGGYPGITGGARYG